MRLRLGGEATSLAVSSLNLAWWAVKVRPMKAILKGGVKANVDAELGRKSCVWFAETQWPCVCYDHAKCFNWKYFSYHSSKNKASFDCLYWSLASLRCAGCFRVSPHSRSSIQNCLLIKTIISTEWRIFATNQSAVCVGIMAYSNSILSVYQGVWMEV